MTAEEKKEKLEEYSTRSTFWTNHALTQFGYSINLFVTFGIGVAGFIITKRDNYPEIIIDCKAPINYTFLLYFISLVFVFLSILFGGIGVISRLYDLRITRHKNFVRKQTLKKLDKLLPEGFIDLSSTSGLKIFISTLRKNIPFVIDSDYKDYENVKNKFNDLRTISSVLGKFSWRIHKLQITFLILSVIIYGIVIL